MHRRYCTQLVLKYVTMDIHNIRESRQSLTLLIWFQSFSRKASIAVALIGCIVILGWICNIAVLKSVLPGLVMMKANTAICLILGGGSLWLWHRQPKTRMTYFAGKVCAVLVILIGLLTLIEYGFNLDLGIDQILFKTSIDPLNDTAPGRMAVHTAVNFFLLGLSLLLLSIHHAKYRIAQFCALVTFWIAFLGLLGYVYSNAYFYKLGSLTSIALHTSVAFILLSLGILFARPDLGLMAVVTSPNAGGIMARRLLPAAIVIPPIVSWLILVGYQHQVYTAELALCLLSILNVIAFVVLIWWNARALGTIDCRRSHAEAALLQTNEELERRVEERTIQLRQTNEQLQNEISERQQAEAALLKSYNLLQTVIDTTPDPIFIKNLQGYYQLINSSGAALFNKSPQEILGQDDSVLFSPEISVRTQAHDRRIMMSGNCETFEETVSIHGEWRTFFTAKSVYRDAEGNIQGLVGFAKDITGLKQTQEVLTQANEILERRIQARTAELVKANAALTQREELLRLFIENTPLAIAMFDRDLRYLAMSQVWLTSYGFEGQNIIGCCHYDIFPNLPERWKAIHQNCLAGAVQKCEEDDFVLPNGSQEWIRWEIHPWRNSAGEVGGIVMFTEVITERKQAEQKLKAAIAELDRSNQELEHFAYVASHDLREPLRKIKSYTDLLVKRYSGQLDEKADKYIAYITDGTERMQALITDLLTYSRVGRGELIKEPTDLGLVLNQTLTNLSTIIQESHAVIQSESLPTINANPWQMGQLLQNLLANAIKFRGEQPPEIDIKASLHDQLWTVSVQDNGIGIEPQYAERIFVIFQRLHTREEYSGTGIGLAVCKKVVERHDGQIWVDSELGRGTTFSFTLPALT